MLHFICHGQTDSNKDHQGLNDFGKTQIRKVITELFMKLEGCVEVISSSLKPATETVTIIQQFLTNSINFGTRQLLSTVENSEEFDKFIVKLPKLTSTKHVIIVSQSKVIKYIIGGFFQVSPEKLQYNNAQVVSMSINEILRLRGLNNFNFYNASNQNTIYFPRSMYPKSWYDDINRAHVIFIQEHADHDIYALINPTDSRAGRMIISAKHHTDLRKYFNYPQEKWNNVMKSIFVTAMEIVNILNKKYGIFVQISLAGNNSHSTINNNFVVGVGPNNNLEPNFPHVHLIMVHSTPIEGINMHIPGTMFDMRNGKIPHDNLSNNVRTLKAMINK